MLRQFLGVNTVPWRLDSSLAVRQFLGAKIVPWRLDNSLALGQFSGASWRQDGRICAAYRQGQTPSYILAPCTRLSPPLDREEDAWRRLHPMVGESRAGRGSLDGMGSTV